MNAVPQLNDQAMFVPMRESDVDDIFAAELRIYRYPWTRGNFSDSLAAGYSAWVCRESGRTASLLGYAVLMLVLDEAHLLNLSIVPERQRQGLGGALLEHLFEVALGHSAKCMYLEVRASNESGLALYERFAFSTIGRRRGYYPAQDGREDAVVMVRKL
jgi:ribosomal-protein-alanine N-acetyltransferase